MTNNNIPPLPTFNNIEARYIPGFPGYAATSDGRVLSCRRGQWKELKQNLPHTYYFVTLYDNDNWHKRKSIGVSRLILLAFVGPCPENCEACHNDGNPLNNHIDNLRWDTHKANMEDAENHGTRIKGETVGLAKLTKQQVKEIRRLSNNHSHRQLATMFGVAKSTISQIIWRKTWKHI